MTSLESVLETSCQPLNIRAKGWTPTNSSTTRTVVSTQPTQFGIRAQARWSSTSLAAPYPNSPAQLSPDLQHHSLTKILLKRDKTLFQKRQKKTHNTASVCGRHGANIDVRILLVPPLTSITLTWFTILVGEVSSRGSKAERRRISTKLSSTSLQWHCSPPT